MIHAAILAITLAAAPGEEKLLRVYFVGNSVTDTINYKALAELAKSRGHTQVWGRHMIPGAPLQWIWEHPKDGFQEPPFGHYPNALGNFSWDVLSLQPFDRHLEGKDGDLAMAKNFIGLALPKSPDLHVYVYARWPRQGKDDFDTAWNKKYTGGWDGTNETRDYFERLTVELRKAYPKLKIHMVPVGHVMYELNQRMKAGEVPGYKSIKEVFVDGIHLNNVGSYVVGCTFCATLYKEDPKGLPGEPYKVTDPKLAEVIQETVWKVVSTNELAGVTNDAADNNQWTSLFNGKNLDGWVIKCRPEDNDKRGYWKVVDGTITAETPAGSKHHYIWLLAEKEYGDFELRLKVQTYSTTTGNSGIQVRSRYNEEAGWLDGPQVDINPPGPWRNGFIYDETREAKIWLWPDVGRPANAKPEHAPQGWKWFHADKEDVWNDVYIACRGTKIKTVVNGVTVADYDGAGRLNDEAHQKHNVGLKGHIGLQIHPGKELLIRFKDIEVRE